MKKTLIKCKPAVRRHWLIFAAGVVWFGVGIGLITAACFWLARAALFLRFILGAAGIVMGIAVHSFGFSRIVRKNLDRIGDKPEVVCLFAFQAWRSYLLILIMMFMGYSIRHLPIPKEIDALIYLTIGSALVLGGSLYYRRFSAENGSDFALKSEKER